MPGLLPGTATGGLLGASGPAGGVVNSEAFSVGFGAWTSPGSLDPAPLPFSITTGPTPTSSTGPNGGSNPTTLVVEGANAYAFTEGSNAGPWSLQSPEMDASLGTFFLKFHLHMRFGGEGGILDGTMLVQGWNGSSWEQIGNAIIGSKQLTAASPWLSSPNFGTYSSGGFDNDDFRFRFLFTKGASQFDFNYDACIDNVTIEGPGDPLVADSGGGGGGGGGGGVDDNLFPATLFGGRFAPWAIHQSQIATHPNSANLVNQIYNVCGGNLTVNVDRFSQAYYDIALANSTIQFVRTETNFGGNLNTGAQIPWNFSLFETPGDFDPTDVDSYIILINEQTGLYYEFFKAVVKNGRLEAGRGTLLKTGVDNDGPNANVFTKQNVNRNSRACGIHHVIGPVLRRDVDRGRIDHALTITWPNPTQFAHQAPAIKGAGGTGGGANRGFMGLRIVWALTENDINTWLTNHVPAAARPTMRLVAEAIRDFGMIGTDHSGSQSVGRGSCSFEHELTAKWSQLGITQDNVRQVLDDLLGNQNAKNKARVLAIPTHVNGSDANVCCYPGIPYPPGHPCNSS